jgi:hypothetical protein
MRRLTLFAALAVTAVSSANAGSNVGVSIDINQPGVYGRINIGNMPPPAVVYAEPVVMVPAPIAVYQQPIFLYVPPAHQANWGRYCNAYSACGQPVYFVQETWVKERYYRSRDDHEYESRDERHGQRQDRGHKHHDD